jgi:hypothetical protein
MKRNFLFSVIVSLCCGFLVAQDCGTSATFKPIATQYPYSEVDGNLVLNIVLVDLVYNNNGQNYSAFNSASSTAINANLIQNHLTSKFSEFGVIINFTSTTKTIPSNAPTSTVAFLNTQYNDDVGSGKIHLLFAAEGSGPPTHFNAGQSIAKDIPSTAAIIKINSQSTQEEINFVAAHELGHCLGLFHVTESGLTPNFIDLLINEMNCADKTDLICDTYNKEDLRNTRLYNPNNNECTIDPGNSNGISASSLNSLDIYNFMNFFSVGEYECAQRYTPLQVLKMRYLLAHYSDLRACLNNPPALASLPNIDGFVTITQNTTWSNDHLVAQLVVKTGATLTINNAKVIIYPTKQSEFNSDLEPIYDFEETGWEWTEKDGMIVIEPGAKLIANGVTFTNSAYGPLQWNGIYVEGNKNASQTQANQGYLQLTSCTIENARTAIQTRRREDNQTLDYTGGIINASHTTFKNNWRDVEFLEYKNIQNGTELRNVSDFRNCTFIKDNDYQGTYDDNSNFLPTPLCAVSMWGVKGVRFRSCTFTNSYDNYLQKTPAIYGLRASPQVKNNSSFSGWSRGVEVHDYCTSVHNIEVSNSTFDDNLIGVYIASSSNALIIDNDINVTKDAVPAGQNNKIPVGLYLDHSTDYTVEENEFKGIGINGQAIGLIVNGSGAVENEIKGNLFYDFENLSNLCVGAAAYGVNRVSQSGSQQGLKFTCNDFGLFNANDVDLFVAAGETPNPQDGIADLQGEPSQGADNLFSVWLSAIPNIENEVSNFSYYYNNGNNRYMPNVLSTGGVTTLNSNQFSNYNNSCGVVFTQSSQSGLPVLQAELTALDNSLSSGKVNLQNLIDNGSTPSLEADILLANAQQHQDLYLDLMTIAPFVSEENLINICELDDFPELALRNIMVANPHGSRSEEVMQALIERQPPLAQQTLDDIENLQQTITTKDVLEGQLSGWGSDKQRLLRSLTYRYGSDSTGVNNAALSSLLSSQTELGYRYQYAEYLYHQGQTANALMVIDSLTNLASASDYEFLAHQGLQGYYQAIAADGNPYINLSTPTLQSMQGLYQNSTGKAKHLALSALLANGESVDYVPPRFLPSGSQNKKAAEAKGGVRPSKANTSFTIFPNPSEKVFIVNWNWFEAGLEGPIDLKIMSTHGQTLQVIKVTNYQNNQQVLDLEYLAVGTYLLEISTQEKTLDVQRLVKR